MPGGHSLISSFVWLLKQLCGKKDRHGASWSPASGLSGQQEPVQYMTASEMKARLEEIEGRVRSLQVSLNRVWTVLVDMNKSLIDLKKP